MPVSASLGSRPSISRILLLLVPACAGLWLFTTRWPPVLEYRLYLTEDRKIADVPWELLSGSWSERELTRRLEGYVVRCRADHTGVPGVSRTCAVDLKALNGVATMYANFLFVDDRLERVASAVPWWGHSEAINQLLQRYGQPQATQAEERAGVRVHGWILSNGSYVFVNRDRGLNPLEPSSIQWLSKDACAPRPCIK